MNYDPQTTEQTFKREFAATTLQVALPLLIWCSFLFTPISEHQLGWTVFVPHPWLIHLWLLFLISNALFFVSIICLALRSGARALIATLCVFPMLVGLGWVYSAFEFRYPALLVLSAAQLVVICLAIAQKCDAWMKNRHSAERFPRTSPNSQVLPDPWAPTRE